MKGDMHRCAAKCCDDAHSSLEDVHRCIETCSEQLNKAQNKIQGDLGHFQDRLQRCVMQCQDSIRDKVGPNTTDAQTHEYKNEFDGCVVKCADSHIDLLPHMLKRMKHAIQ
ncbi:protein FAM136A-like isoform X2 [Ornithodoros turicata]|uniref:protein FAM136A-like isoform X2 n=1 Tax=Ornithodoros turicata TaxID=34597 RepID=UPI00313A3D8C